MGEAKSRTQDKRATTEAVTKKALLGQQRTAVKAKVKAGGSGKLVLGGVVQPRTARAGTTVDKTVITEVKVSRIPIRSAPEAKTAAPRTTSYATAFADLGDGYAIVRLVPSVPLPGKQSAAPAVPKPIPVRTIRRLLTNLADRETPSGAADAAGQADNDAFMANLRQQASRSRADLLAEGKLLESADLCERLQVSRQAVSKAVAEHRLFSLDGDGGRKLYPAFYGDAALPRRDIERVAQALGPLPGPVKWQFFTTPATSLQGKTPVEAISKGRIEDVLRAAGGFRERELGN